MVRGVCPVCAGHFEVNKYGRPKKYCSFKCKEERLEKCAACGAWYKRLRSHHTGRRCCSAECAGSLGARWSWGWRLVKIRQGMGGEAPPPYPGAVGPTE